MEGSAEETRANEWYVPKYGPRRFRLFLGLTFWPYTLMNASYVIIGSLLAPVVHLDRAGGLALAYLLAVGIAAHALDAMAPNKPWGDILSRRQLLVLALGSLTPALGIGLYYALTFAPFLLIIGLFELFFLLAYNLELFGGLFHTDPWFALSWGFLPVLAGYVLQTDSLNLTALAGGSFGFFTSYVEINASRPYKALKKEDRGLGSSSAAKFESILKGIVASVLAVAAFLLAFRLLG